MTGNGHASDPVSPVTAENVPAPLTTLGQVFVPIPPRQKGTHRPRTPEHLYGPDDATLEAYLEAAADLQERTTAEPAVEIPQRQVFSHLEAFAERGALERAPNPADARGYVWRADGLYRLGDYGEVELDTVSGEMLPDTAVAEVARMSPYTWAFRNTGDLA